MFNKPTIYGEVETITRNGVSFDKEPYESACDNSQDERHKNFVKSMMLMVNKLVNEKIKECFPKIEEITRERSELMAANSRLQSSLESERKNRCCGNCGYFLCRELRCLLISDGVCQFQSPCEYWQPCRSEISREELVLEFQSNLDKISALQSENAALQSALTAEMKNRCCGNCLYMDTIFEITGERQCEITKRSADKESDPCEHWRSCRGQRMSG